MARRHRHAPRALFEVRVGLSQNGLAQMKINGAGLCTAKMYGLDSVYGDIGCPFLSYTDNLEEL